MDKSTIIQLVIGLCLIVAFVTRICFFQSFDSYMKSFKKILKVFDFIDKNRRS